MKSISIIKLVCIVVVAFLVIGVGYGLTHNRSATSRNGKLQVVAAENFWGSLVSQLGGSKLHVTSIVSDPDADPHEYSSSTANARAFADADYVVINGAGYDSWANKLLSASQGANRKVLNIANLIGKKNGDNPHFWYSPAYVNQTVAQMEKDLIAIDPGDKVYFQQQYQKLQDSLSGYQDRINAIKQQYGGEKVAATEDIFVYLASATGLDLISPPSFIEAVAEGNDPPTSSVIQFEQQLQNGQAKVLVFNKQTVTPITTTMQKLASEHHIPIVGVTETTQPPNQSFQVWMNDEIIDLQNALKGVK